MDGLSVRAATRDDAPVLADYQVSNGMETQELALDYSTVLRGVLAVFDDPEKGRYWVAENEERVVGMMLTVAQWSDWSNGMMLWLHSIYVAPEARRQGVIGALYAYLKQLVLDSPRLLGLRTLVDQNNVVDQRTVGTLGMRPGRYLVYEWFKPT